MTTTNPTEVRKNQIAEAALQLAQEHKGESADPIKGIFVAMMFALGADAKDNGKTLKEAITECEDIINESVQKGVKMLAVVTVSLGYTWAEQHPKDSGDEQ